MQAIRSGTGTGAIPMAEAALVAGPSAVCEGGLSERAGRLKCGLRIERLLQSEPDFVSNGVEDGAMRHAVAQALELRHQLRAERARRSCEFVRPPAPVERQRDSDGARATGQQPVEDRQQPPTVFARGGFLQQLPQIAEQQVLETGIGGGNCRRARRIRHDHGTPRRAGGKCGWGREGLTNRGGIAGTRKAHATAHEMNPAVLKAAWRIARSLTNFSRVWS